MLWRSETQNFILWRAVWNEHSISTPCRIVFDASQSTASWWSLNDILAKRENSMSKLVEIVICWSIHRLGIHTDIKNMYNSVKLVEDDWCLQQYIWWKDLDPRKLPEEKVIKILFYGVRSSGNQEKRDRPKYLKYTHKSIKLFKMTSMYIDDCL